MQLPLFLKKSGTPLYEKEQELRPLKKISNSFKKIIITKYGGNNFYDEDGILHMNLFDFLLDEKII